MPQITSATTVSMLGNHLAECNWLGKNRKHKQTKQSNNKIYYNVLAEDIV